MRTLALALVALLLCSCITTQDPSSPVSPVVNLGVYTANEFSGEGLQHPVQIGPYPWTFPIRYWGSGVLVLQYPAKPHVWFDGEGGYVVEPLYPQQRDAILAAMQRGEFAITQNGKPGRLAPAGTVASKKENP